MFVTGFAVPVSRSPYGERGLKSVPVHPEFRGGKSLSLRRAWIEIRRRRSRWRCRSSLSLRRAWIEIMSFPPCFALEWCRSPYGERGLKSRSTAFRACAQGRSPYGERGLKLLAGRTLLGYCRSLSLRRAWIEMYLRRHFDSADSSLSLRRAWIEISAIDHKSSSYMSLSLRRAWIEICCRLLFEQLFGRRSPYGERGLKCPDVERLACGTRRSPYGERGLKCSERHHRRRGRRSLSLRRAWIEIP